MHCRNGVICNICRVAHLQPKLKLLKGKHHPSYRPTAVDGAAAMAGRKGTPPTRSAHSRICYPSAHGHWCCRRLADPPNPFALVCTPPPTSATTQPTARIYRNTATNQHHSTAPIHRCYRNHGARGGQILLLIPPKITHEPLSHDGSTSWRPFPTARPSEIEQFCVLGDRRTGERTRTFLRWRSSSPWSCSSLPWSCSSSTAAEQIRSAVYPLEQFCAPFPYDGWRLQVWRGREGNPFLDCLSPPMQIGGPIWTARWRIVFHATVHDVVHLSV